MTHVLYHAQSAARVFGGTPDPYIPLHAWMDETKEHFCDYRHRAIRHHSQGIFLGEKVFGTSITNSEGKEVLVRLVFEQHIVEDCNFVPTLADWLSCIHPEPWMARATPTRLGRQHRERRNPNE